MKFSKLSESGQPESFEYSNIFFEEELTTGTRLTIGPRTKQVNLIDLLASNWNSNKFYILYVLLVSHGGREPGRYQSPIIESFEELRIFLYTFQEFFEGDGRHHIWVSSACGSMLIYDQHNVVFAYGNIEEYKKQLINNGYTEKDFAVPTPHVHNYPPSNVKYEDDLFEYWQWERFPLEDGDEY